MKAKSLKRASLLSLFCLGVLTGSLEPMALAAGKTTQPSAEAKEDAKNPRIRAGDSISITVYPAEEYNREVSVQPDGKIELSLIGSMSVVGLTAKELQDLLESKYAKYVDSPKVTVATRHFAGRKVAIIGEIKGPGFYEYRDGMKLLELVSMAGGLGDNARATRVGILRDGAAEGTHFNFQAVLEGQLSRDLVLLPGDTIYIPKTALNKKSTWIANNILPYLSLAGLVASLTLLAK